MAPSSECLLIYIGRFESKVLIKIETVYQQKHFGVFSLSIKKSGFPSLPTLNVLDTCCIFTNIKILDSFTYTTMYFNPFRIEIHLYCLNSRKNSVSSLIIQHFIMLETNTRELFNLQFEQETIVCN